MRSLTSSLDYLVDTHRRHIERHTVTGCVFVLADRVRLINRSQWELIAQHQSVFLSWDYLHALEAHPPENVESRYAVIYHPEQLDAPLAIVHCQLATLSLTNFQARSPGEDQEALTSWISSRVLICGNVLSSGLHGVAFSPEADLELGWRAVAEVIYKMRRAEQLQGVVDGAVIKDVSSDHLSGTAVLSRYSYRTIKTDPDMVITLTDAMSTFEDYLTGLRSKVRRKVKKVARELEQSGYTSSRLDDIGPHEPRLLELYRLVEAGSDVRLASISKGYLTAMSDALGDRFVCSVIRREGEIVAFVTTVKDRERGLSYYVGFDREMSDSGVIYRRLLQLSIEDALAMGCKKISLGRTALEAKANLGAKPVPLYVWARHRVPTVNFFARKLFRLVPSSVAPERTVFKQTEVKVQAC